MVDGVSQSQHGGAGVTMANSNATVNNVYGSVHTIINSNSISNSVVYGITPNESVHFTVAFGRFPLTSDSQDILQIKICAGQKIGWVIT